jgi:hypothetical protein
MRRNRNLALLVFGLSVLVYAALDLPILRAAGQTAPAISIDKTVPDELNPPYAAPVIVE